MPAHVPVKRVFATSFRSRLRGLIGRDERWLPPGSELVFLRCRSVHTFFMRRLLDVAFVGPDGIVLRAERDVFPRAVLHCKGAAAAIERFAGERGTHWYRKGEDANIKIV